jgi:hypothetical protein
MVDLKFDFNWCSSGFDLNNYKCQQKSNAINKARAIRKTQQFE